MGAWSEENFGNDDANDWIYDLEKSKGTNTLIKPLNNIIQNNDYLESSYCCEALAAAEVIAASKTQDFTVIPKEAQKWLTKKQGVIFGKPPEITSEYVTLAKQAVEKVLKNSELKELWEETEDFIKWQIIQQTLIKKLTIV